MSKLTIFTASDDGYFPFLEGLIQSIEDRKKEGIKRVSSLRVVVFDTGLLPKQVKKISKFAEVVDIKNLDLREFFGDAFKGNGRGAGMSSSSAVILSLAIRPFLPKWAGDSEILMWMDSDAWLQDSEGVEQMVWAANLNTIAVVPETGRLVIYAAYRQEVKIADLYQYFDIEVSSPIINLPILNAGVFAARVDSPLWREWEKDIKEALTRSGGVFRFGLDQVCFNHAIYHNSLMFSPLPFECDYCTSLTNLIVIDGKICSSAVPFEPAHTIHMTGNNKWIEQLVIVLDRDGNEIERFMTKIDYLTMRKLRA